MELESRDQDVVSLLTTLKKADGAYPPELLSLQRERFLSRMASIAPGPGYDAGIQNNISITRIMNSLAVSWVEAVLAAAILIEAGVAFYLYRKEVREAVQPDPPPPAAVISASETGTLLSPILPEAVTATPAHSTATALPTASPSAAPAPSSAADNQQNDPDPPSGPGSQSNATPAPNDNNGNHYGQTPRPERTKDPGGGDNDNDKGRDD
jgi:hypothetical protein